MMQYVPIADFGARLREERVRKGLNQADFAALGGVSKNSQLSYERGSSPANVEYLLALGAQGVDVAYLMTGRRFESDPDVGADTKWLLDAWFRLSTRERDGVMQLILTLAGLTTDLPAVAMADATPATIHQPGRGFRGEGDA